MRMKQYIAFLLLCLSISLGAAQNNFNIRDYGARSDRKTDDAPAIQRHAADARLAVTSHVPHPYPSDGAERFVARRLADRDAGTHYPLVVTTSGALVGLLGLNALDRATGSAEVDCWVAVPFWDRGIATSAVRLGATLAFTGLQLRVLEAISLDMNVAARRVLEKTGFTEVDAFVNEGRGDGRFVGQRMRRYRLRDDDRDWQRTR